jgi:hypothetical protein
MFLNNYLLILVLCGTEAKIVPDDRVAAYRLTINLHDIPGLHGGGNLLMQLLAHWAKHPGTI